jgi:hypothetical protein
MNITFILHFFRIKNNNKAANNISGNDFGINFGLNDPEIKNSFIDSWKPCNDRREARRSDEITKRQVEPHISKLKPLGVIDMYRNPEKRE